MKPYKELMRQLKRQKRMYMATIFSYDQISTNMLMTNDSKSSVNQYKVLYEDNDNRIGHSKKEIINNYQKRYQYELRELIIVRLISALEVFLVDMVSDLFILRTDLFKDHSKIMEFSQARMLSYNSITEIQTEIIRKIRRELHSGGFERITKYYYTGLGIKLKDFQVEIDDFTYNWYSIKEFHVKRHLIVHELGKTDKQYKETYTKDSRISISDDELMKIINVIEAFGTFCNSKLIEIQSSYFEVNKGDNIIECNITIIGDANNIENLIRRKALMYHDDVIIDINKYHLIIVNNANSLELIIRGNSLEIALVKNYIKKLIKTVKNDVSKTIINHKILTHTFDDDTIEDIITIVNDIRNINKSLRYISQEYQVSEAFVYQFFKLINIPNVEKINYLEDY